MMDEYANSLARAQMRLASFEAKMPPSPVKTKTTDRLADPTSPIEAVDEEEMTDSSEEFDLPKNMPGMNRESS